MKSEWRTTSNYFGGKLWYGVYRLKDVDALDHSGNREHKGGYFQTRKEAEALAEYLNNEEEKDDKH